MDETEVVFKSINERISNLTDGVSTLDKAIDEVIPNKDKVVLIFTDISSASEEISASSQEILNSVDDQKESTIVIGTVVNALEEAGCNLDRIVNSFHMEQGDLSDPYFGTPSRDACVSEDMTYVEYDEVKKVLLF